VPPPDRKSSPSIHVRVKRAAAGRQAHQSACRRSAARGRRAHSAAVAFSRRSRACPCDGLPTFWPLGSHFSRAWRMRGCGLSDQLWLRRSAWPIEFHSKQIRWRARLPRRPLLDRVLSPPSNRAFTPGPHRLRCLAHADYHWLRWRAKRNRHRADREEHSLKIR